MDGYPFDVGGQGGQSDLYGVGAVFAAGAELDARIFGEEVLEKLLVVGGDHDRDDVGAG